MYPEKPKREEKPKRDSGRRKQALSRFILALLFLVPSIFVLLPRFNQEQFIHMFLVTVMITLAVYLVYQMVILFFATLHDIHREARENGDL